MIGTAVISEDKLYRYVLTREWKDGQLKERRCTWIVLHPSSGTAKKNDATVNAVSDFSRRLGFNAMSVVALYAWRSIKIGPVFNVRDPIGPMNDSYIRRECQKSERVFCTWGRFGEKDRADEVRALLKELMIPTWVLGFTKNGQPAHPLSVEPATPPTLWRM